MPLNSRYPAIGVASVLRLPQSRWAPIRRIPDVDVERTRIPGFEAARPLPQPIALVEDPPEGICGVAVHNRITNLFTSIVTRRLVSRNPNHTQPLGE